MVHKSKIRRCTVCRHQVGGAGTLKSRLMKKHYKRRIVRKLFQSCLLKNNANVVLKAKRRQTKRSPTNNKAPTTGLKSGQQNEKSEQLPQTKKSKKLSIESRESSTSLHEHTGEFYECHCMKVVSDTESCSDTTQTYYCNFCGDGYQTVTELTEHEKLHQIQCRICSQFLNVQSYRDHFQQHILRVYACHVCGFECICKEVLTRHLDYHLEQQTLENILDMEQEYNVYRHPKNYFALENFHSNINNLLFFLTSSHEQPYARNVVRKVACPLCFQEISVYEYELHLKLAHLIEY